MLGHSIAGPLAAGEQVLNAGFLFEDEPLLIEDVCHLEGSRNFLRVEVSADGARCQGD